LAERSYSQIIPPIISSSKVYNFATGKKRRDPKDAWKYVI